MLRAMEAEILDGPVPVIDPAEEARLTNADTKLAEAMRQLRCRGECTQAAPCSNCKTRRTYLALLLHRERYGRAPHPSKVAAERDAARDTPAEATEEQLGILLSTVQPQRVEWLWPARIPLSKLTIIDGDPGLGKSVLTLDLAARVSRGVEMPDGAAGRQGGVVLLTAEDGIRDTVVPRLDAAGADRSRVLALDLVPDAEGGQQLPRLPLDAPYIDAAVRRMGALLVVVDPLTAYLSERINSHRDQDCRRALWPLTKLAEETGAAVVVVRHLNKGNASNPLYRGGGSIGIIGAARSGLLVAHDPDNTDKRVLAPTKCNLAKLPASLGFALDTASNGALRIGWTGASSHTAKTLLAAPADGEDRGAVQDAVEVLRTILANDPDPVLVKDVKREARRAGVSDITLRRAKTILGVRSSKLGFGSAAVWRWSLPSEAP